jgi:hypothetical protein
MAVENLPRASVTNYSVQIAHSRIEGIVASPVAGPGIQNASLVRLHSPFERISVFWTAICTGAPPFIPSEKSYLKNMNRVFLGGERCGVVTPDMVGHIWHAAGRYDYIVLAAEGLSSPFCLAKVPWELGKVQDFYIPSTNFLSQGIINDTWLQPSGVAADADVAALDMQLLSGA